MIDTEILSIKVSINEINKNFDDINNIVNYLTAKKSLKLSDIFEHKLMTEDELNTINSLAKLQK